MAYNDGVTEKGLLNSIRKITANFGKARAHENLDISAGTVFSLTVPDNAHYAQIRITTTAAAANTPVAWYLMDGGTPAANTGIPLLGWEMLDITDYENLKNFKIISIGLTETLCIQYFNLQY